MHACSSKEDWPSWEQAVQYPPTALWTACVLAPPLNLPAVSALPKMVANLDFHICNAIHCSLLPGNWYRKIGLPSHSCRGQPLGVYWQNTNKSTVGVWWGMPLPPAALQWLSRRAATSAITKSAAGRLLMKEREKEKKEIKEKLHR